MAIRFTLNEQSLEWDGDPAMPLLCYPRPGLRIRRMPLAPRLRA
jgi:hypothetical protein